MFWNINFIAQPVGQVFYWRVIERNGEIDE